MSTKVGVILAAVLLVSAALVVACGSGEEEEEAFPNVIRIGEQAITPVLPNSEIVVGRNRFIVGLLDEEGVPIVDAKVHLTFYDLNGAEPVARFEKDAVSRVPARDAGIDEQVVHIHADGTRHVHVNVTDEVGVYTAMVEFDRAGVWGVEIRLESKDGKIKETLRPRFNVLERGATPAIGEPAPLSRQRLPADVGSIEEIDSSAEPEPDFHRMTIAEAIESGRPALVFFGVPGYCTSRFCGPQYEIMKKLLPHYRGQIEFIHVEFFKNPGSRERQPAEVTQEWNLRTEPWFFLIDRNGLIAAKFEGPTSLQELEDAIDALN
jgi:hypothetical protein